MRSPAALLLTSLVAILCCTADHGRDCSDPRDYHPCQAAPAAPTGPAAATTTTTIPAHPR
jgi:hypothetical protein